MSPIDRYTIRTHEGPKEVTRDMCPHACCNVFRVTCGECEKWVSFCLSHDQPTKHHRCECDLP